MPSEDVLGLSAAALPAPDTRSPRLFAADMLSVQA